MISRKTGLLALVVLGCSQPSIVPQGWSDATVDQVAPVVGPGLCTMGETAYQVEGERSGVKMKAIRCCTPKGCRTSVTHLAVDGGETAW